MPRYHLHFRNGGVLIPDRDGAKIPAVEDAYLEAYNAGRELWHQLLLKR
jgi:hypothetical protein